MIVTTNLVLFYDDAHNIGREDSNRDCELIHRPKSAATE
jgi:hypothetical protein